jgi:hypothetical protein
MGSVRIHRLSTGSVANGASYEGSWKSDAKYTLREVLITPRGNSVLTNVQFYADIDGVPFFRPDVPADLLDPLNPIRPVLALPFAKGSSFNYKLTNNSGAAETYDISLVLETETWPPA